MNNIKTTQLSVKEQSKVLASRDCWLMSVLYTFTFGTFIGFAAVLPIMFSSLFNRIDFALYALIGASLSSIIRPLSNVLAKYTGAVKLTLLSFIIMLIGLVFMLFAIPTNDDGGSFPQFIAAYMLIFVGTGLGKGSTTSMIPEIYQVMALKKALIDNNTAKHLQNAASSTATVLGITSAIATFVAFLTPKIFDLSQSHYGNMGMALWFFIIAKVACLLLTWWCYGRKTVNNPLCVVTEDGNSIIIDRPHQHAIFDK